MAGDKQRVKHTAGCEICGRTLSNFKSLKYGIGPICRTKGEKQMKLPFEYHAEYRIVTANNQFYYIEDTGHTHTKTVTNDALFVLEDLKKNYGLGEQRLFYRDSLGAVDELLHKEGRFCGFKPGRGGYTTEELLGIIKAQDKPVKRKRDSGRDIGR